MAKFVMMFYFFICSYAFASCDVFDVKNGSDVFKLSVPKGFIDACKSSEEFCQLQVKHFPDTSKLIGFFVKPDEWKKSKLGKRPDQIRTHLIAQVAEGTTLDEFENDKKMIRNKNGKVQDNTKPRKDYKFGEPYNLGIFEEDSDSITFGAITNATPVDQPQNTLYLASANIFTRMNKKRVLSLYVFHRVKRDETTFIRNFTKKWLLCLKTK